MINYTNRIHAPPTSTLFVNLVVSEAFDTISWVFVLF